MDERPEIQYPCRWVFQLVGEQEEAIRVAVADIAAADPHEIERSRSSRTGKYVSMRLTVTVRDEPHRLAIQQSLAGHAAIRLVL